MDFKMEKGVIVRVAADDDKKKKGKGDGVAAAIGLLQELRGFMEKVEACVEAQDIAENKASIEEPAKSLEALYNALIKIAQSGIRSMGTPSVGSDEASAPAVSKEEAKPALPMTPSVPPASKIG